MADKYTQTEIQSSVPGDFQEVVHYKLSDSTSRGIPILAIFLFLLSGSLFLAFALTIGKLDLSFTQGGFKIGIWEAGVGLAAIPATIVFHEVVHGLTMRMFGAQPKYGMLRTHLVFYATAPGYAFQRNACITVEIAPFVVLSVLAIMGLFILQGSIWVPLLAVCAAMNAGGAAADLWMTSKIFRYSKAAYIIDERDGFKVLTGP
ncbi:MAG: DUF3267 domain-containing protein [Anaerolineaceae bacterium]|nr:DUF3267 domain-containing protein [Anaerolineaceae bacterium]